ncbi:MAG: hypothetical protein JWR59_2274 [Brevundimonas sp.]|nr:hypothetical protein [Brevundimonas sp.]
MAALILPTYPGPSSMTPRPITARNELRPAYGGPVTRTNRPGTRWAWDCDWPPMTYVESLEFDDILSETDTIVMDILQPGLDTGSPGAPQVNGAGQLGTTLNLKGVTPGYVFRKGQWLSVAINGQWFAYKSSGAATAAAGGLLAVPLRTMIRLPAANSAVVKIAQPVAEGFVSVDPGSMQIDVDGFVRLKFTLEERE